MAEKMEKKYVLTNRRSGKALAANGSAAVQYTADGSDAQIWRAVPVEGTSVQLVQKSSGLALTVSGEAENGTELTLAEAAGGAQQLWKLTTTTKGYRKLVHAASGKVVDIKQISDADNAPAQLWDFVKGENQDWVLTEVEKEKKAPAKRAVKEVKCRTAKTKKTK
ncbi:MAG: RICIN domain-containing protein [Hominenteromicrobium sp.]